MDGIWCFLISRTLPGVLGALGVQPVHAIMNAPESVSMYLALSSADGWDMVFPH